MKCPKCGSANIDEFENAWWYLCRDCGYNSPSSYDRDAARRMFEEGEKDVIPAARYEKEFNAFEENAGMGKGKA